MTNILRTASDIAGTVLAVSPFLIGIAAFFAVSSGLFGFVATATGL